MFVTRTLDRVLRLMSNFQNRDACYRDVPLAFAPALFGETLSRGWPEQTPKTTKIQGRSTPLSSAGKAFETAAEN